MGIEVRLRGVVHMALNGFLAHGQSSGGCNAEGQLRRLVIAALTLPLGREGNGNDEVDGGEEICVGKVAGHHTAKEMPHLRSVALVFQAHKRQTGFAVWNIVHERAGTLNVYLGPEQTLHTIAWLGMDSCQRQREYTGGTEFLLAHSQSSAALDAALGKEDAPEAEQTFLKGAPHGGDGRILLGIGQVGADIYVES